MKVKEYKYYLDRGLGRAVTYLQEHPQLAHKYFHAILYACTHNTAYDPQCENSRERYLYEIINLSNNRGLLEQKIIETLSKTKKFNWDTIQMISLVKIFAEDGNSCARQVIYDKFLESLQGNEYVGSTEIMELDKEKGFIFLVNAIGERIISDQDYWEDDWLLNCAYEQFGEEETERLLIKEANSKPAIKAFLAVVNSYKESANNEIGKSKGIESYLEIKEKIAGYKANDYLYKFSRWGKTAGQEDLECAARDFLKENDELRLIPYLAVFYQRNFPFELNKIIEIAKSPNERLATAAFRVLKRYEDVSIHDLAVELIIKGDPNPDVLELFENNYLDTDIEYLEKVFFNNYNDFDYHGIGLLLIHIFEKHKTTKCQKLMIELYKNGKCSSCRGWVVDILIDNNILPDWMAQECLYDSNFDIRQRVSDYLI